MIDTVEMKKEKRRTSEIVIITTNFRQLIRVYFDMIADFPFFIGEVEVNSEKQMTEIKITFE